MFLNIGGIPNFNDHYKNKSLYAALADLQVDGLGMQDDDCVLNRMVISPVCYVLSMCSFVCGCGVGDKSLPQRCVFSFSLRA